MSSERASCDVSVLVGVLPREGWEGRVGGGAAADWPQSPRQQH